MVNCGRGSLALLEIEDFALLLIFVVLQVTDIDPLQVLKDLLMLILLCVVNKIFLIRVLAWFLL